LGGEYSLSSWQGFVDAINISNGGLTIIGGIFGGALGVFFCCLRNRKYSLMHVADCVVIAVLLGQIIGRWGNFFNQELYGIEVTNESLQRLPFAVFIDATGKWHYASFFFEGTLNAVGLAIALVMYFVPKKPLKNGTFSIFYLGWYGLVRGSLEFIKDGDPVTFGNSDVKVVQVICYIVFIVCIVLQVLLQFGKISFETKWFKNLCDKRLERSSQKARNMSLVKSATTTDNEEQPAENTDVSQLTVLEEIKYTKDSSENKKDDLQQ
jgi:prolipoprotein diacylglyceryl transferase